MGWESKADRARKLHRPSLKNWECDNLYHKFPAFYEELMEREKNGQGKYESFIISRRSSEDSNVSGRGGENVKNKSIDTCIPKVLDAKSTSVKEFTEKYESNEIPCVIRGIPQHASWAALDKWDIESLDNSSSLRNRVFKVGEDDDGNSIKL